MAAKAGDYDVAIAGASLSGCTAAILLSRAGARVALVEKRPDPQAFKRMCSHYIQASAMPTLERLGLYEPILAAGAQRARGRVWTRWGWIEPTEKPTAYGLNLRRQVLDPLVRQAAADEPGVDLLQGWSAERLLGDGQAFQGLAVRNPDGDERELRARLTVGADGRDSRVAELAGVKEKASPHGRAVYGAYFAGTRPSFAPDASAWLLDPQFAGAFPTDEDLVLYVAMITKDRLPEFKEDRERALVDFVAAIPDAPPIRQGRRVGPVVGKLEMPNRTRGPIAPGLALVGDAALAIDPLFGVGCGWALQSGEWLADSVSPALRGIESLDGCLRRYRRRHRRGLGEHAALLEDFASGRRLNLGERLTMSAAGRDPQAAALFEALGTRRRQPHQIFLPLLGRSLAVHARRLAGAR